MLTRANGWGTNQKPEKQTSKKQLDANVKVFSDLKFFITVQPDAILLCL